VDQPIVQYEGTGTTDRRFMGADERGSIISLTDSSGTVINLNRYDEYGKPQSTNSGRFQYTGQKWIGEAGLYDYKARAYLPHLGIFAQTDPVGYQGGANLYAYVVNSPINLTDPSGTQATLSTFESETGTGQMTPGAAGLDSFSFQWEGVMIANVSGRLDEIAIAREIAASLRAERVAYTCSILACNDSGQPALLNLAAASASIGNILIGDHDWSVITEICPASWGCSGGLVGSVYPIVSNGVPGNQSTAQIVSGQKYTVYAGGVPVGQVKTYVGAGGLTVNNITLINHIFCCGWVNRNALFDTSGAWYSITHGKGTNYYGGFISAMWNQALGPSKFYDLDMSIRAQLYKKTH
jgi:RHS repeat-associated protein